MVESIDWVVALSLLRWQRTRRSYDENANLAKAGIILLQPDANANFGPESALRRAELAFNVSWQRIASEVLQFAVNLSVRVQHSDVKQRSQALRLLQQVLNVFAVKGNVQQTSLPLNSCNLLLSALAEMLETIQQDTGTMQLLSDVRSVFRFLFGLSSDLAAANFRMYRPPTNVYVDFLKRSLTAVFEALKSVETSDVNEQTIALQHLYMDVVQVALSVFHELQKTQTNKKKVFLSIAKTSLRDFVAYRHALVTLLTQGIPSSKATIALLDNVIEDALFDPEHLCQYDNTMGHCAIWKANQNEMDAAQEGEKGQALKKPRTESMLKASFRLVSYQKNLFDELQRLLLDKDVPVVVKASAGGLFKMLVRGFATRIRAAASTKIEDTKIDLKTNRKRAAIVIATTSTIYSPFKFWSELCAVAYSAFQQETKKIEYLPVIVTLYHALFRVLYECDVYRVTEDTEEREQFQTMEKVLSSFVAILNAEFYDGVTSNTDQIKKECDIVSSAAQCSPNLVSCCLVPILELLGTLAVKQCSVLEKNNCLEEIGSTVVSLIRAYDSMRLLDVFLTSVSAMQRAHEGLYVLFLRPSCEYALRKAFVALPPGQMEILWKQIVEKLKSRALRDDNVVSAREVAVTRLVFSIFLQEIHVLPQNRSKVVELVLFTYKRLLSSCVDDLNEVAVPFTSYQRELFCIFGELLVFDSILDENIRNQTFNLLFAILRGSRFVSVMTQLLNYGSFETTEKKRKHTKVISYSAGHELCSTGIIKLCLFWLRRAEESGDTVNCGTNLSRKGRENVARLVLKYVVKWKCWEAVSFHLPELMANASSDECDQTFREILSSYICEAAVGDLNGPATRLLHDAAFYEIENLRDVAPKSLSIIANQFVHEIQHESVTCMMRPHCFFKLLVEVPSDYLKLKDCSNLFAAVFSFYEAITAAKYYLRDLKSEVCQTLLSWTHMHLSLIRRNDHKTQSQLTEQLRFGARIIFSQLLAGNAISMSLIAEVVGVFLDFGANGFVGELLGSILSNMNGKVEPTLMTRELKGAAVVVEALAVYRTTMPGYCMEEEAFFEKFVEIVILGKVCETMTSPLSFEVFTAIVKYQSFLLNYGKGLPMLVNFVENALTASMKLVVMSDSTSNSKLQGAAWFFFENFCNDYSSFRSFLPPLKTYGCLLAVSLSLGSRDVSELKVKGAMQALVANANREEFCLLLSTVLQELVSCVGRRKLSALLALCLLLDGDQKLNASRRLLLNERKNSILEALLQIFTINALEAEGNSSDICGGRETVYLWNLKVFVLVFCKADFFTWNSFELQHVFKGFEPLLVALSELQSGTPKYKVQDLHELWTLSYTLLLRIVRNHFISLVNGIPHLIQATNALLQLLVLASASPEYSRYCSDWSSNLARLYGYMKEHDVQLRKHVVYLLMAYFVGVTRDKLAVRYQQKLRPGVFALFDVCSSYEKEQLFGALDSTGKSVFKALDTNYKLTHRYVGKV
ncbi:uncharacterized protein CCR75_008520 [Bremia lactucae]|uniref:Nucleolar 27S pre-rRNA processing Urb2/Npa2 C-terminal domain-containing protein n=1 Tax=Bremia lactucae TaxID=4779 RepID=A0A976NYT3_BRELC|nr:hypothetical protein CCR75_008520 [Bremia lactucae]